MSVSLSPTAKCQFNQGGIPLAGGLLFTYAAGTTTKLSTYTDSTGGTPNTNPIVLDANGQCNLWLTDNLAYKFVLSPSTDTDPPTNAYWTVNNVTNLPSATPTFTTLTVTGAASIGGALTVTGAVNKVTITPPATSSTLTIADGRTLTVNNTLTFTGTNGSSVAFGAGGTAVFTGAATGSGLTMSTATLLGRTTAATGAIEEITVGTGLSLSAGSLISTVVNSLPKSTRTSNTILASADRATFIDVTSGTFTQTFTAAATLGNGWWCLYRNSGTGVVTIPSSDGVSNWNIFPQEQRIFGCDGSNFFSQVLHPFYLKTTSTITYIQPPGYIEIEVDLVGGGGQGGAGRRGAAGTIRSGGAPGGAPARVIRKLRNITAGSSTTVTIGAGGTTGGAAQTVDSNNGADGQAGGNTTFGSLVTAYGGAAGAGGGTTRAATSGSGSAGAGASTNTAAGLLGGLPSNSGVMGNNTSGAGATSNISEGGGGCYSSVSVGGNTEYGGASSAQTDMTGTAVSNSGSSLRGVSAGSAGGWITAADTLPATASNAGLNGTYAVGGGATGGTCGAAPTIGGTGADAATDDVCGNPGAGGGSTITGSTAAKAGGPGGSPGGPGGGGGAVLNGSLSGAGGAGANGRAIIKGVV